MPESEPITFVVERGAGGRETAALYVDKLPERLTAKGAKLLVYALRLDKLSDGEEFAWCPVRVRDLYATYCRLRDTGTLPPANLADPPKKADDGETKGVLRGEPSWWKPKPMPRPEGWQA